MTMIENLAGLPETQKRLNWEYFQLPTSETRIVKEILPVETAFPIANTILWARTYGYQRPLDKLITRNGSQFTINEYQGSGRKFTSPDNIPNVSDFELQTFSKSFPNLNVYKCVEKIRDDAFAEVYRRTGY